MGERKVPHRRWGLRARVVDPRRAWSFSSSRRVILYFDKIGWQFHIHAANRSRQRYSKLSLAHHLWFITWSHSPGSCPACLLLIIARTSRFLLSRASTPSPLCSRLAVIRGGKIRPIPPLWHSGQLVQLVVHAHVPRIYVITFRFARGRSRTASQDKISPVRPELLWSWRSVRVRGIPRASLVYRAASGYTLKMQDWKKRRISTAEKTTGSDDKSS